MNPEARTAVHVFSTFGAGGPQIRAGQLMGHLGPGWRHVVLAMDGCLDAAPSVPDGLEVEYAPAPPPGGLLATLGRQRRWLDARRPDLVLTYNWGAIESAIAARFCGLPLVHHEDGFGPEEAKRRLRRRNWIRRLALRGVPVVVPSSALQEIARREWRIDEGNLHHLVNGVDLARFAPRPGEGGSPEEIVFGTVGGLRGEKDHDTLLRAFAALDGGRLCLVGAGPLRPALEARAEELSIGPRVRFVGAVRDTAPEYRAFDVFVLSSRTEQMPIALLEAMASGCAVVATDVGDVRAVLPPAQRELVVAPEDPAALTAAMRRLLTDAAWRAELGDGNRRWVAEHFEARRCLDRFAALYLGVARRR